MTTTPIDDEGRCPCHAFVQLSRRSPRTGEWKSLLDSCPLCVIDTKPTAGSVCSRRCSETESENRRVDTVAAPAARQRGRNKMPPPPSRRSRSTSCVGSRVRFQPIKDEQFTSASSLTKAKTAKSVLRASPRYKVCEELMQQQLDDSVKVTTMSMDMDISMEFSTYDDEGSMSGIINSRNGEKQNVQLDHCVENDDEYADIVVVDEELESPLNRPESYPSLPQPLQEDSDVASTKMQDGEERSEGNKSASSSRRSYQQVQTARHRPDPEESLCDEVSCSGSQTSNQAYRVRRNLPSQFRSGPSQQQRGRREVGVGGHQQRSKSTSSSLHLHQESLSPRPQSVSPSTSQDEDTMQSLNPSPGSCIRLDHHNNLRQPEPIQTDMVIIPEPNDDEVSALTFTGYSGRSSIASCPINYCSSICENSSQEQYENVTLPSAAKVTDNTEPAPAFTLSAMMTDTNEFNPRTGRCIHHPQVRLRKKKLFGGWKVMMSACPDCCVAELRRIRLAEENRSKLALEQKSFDRCSRQFGDITDDSRNIDSRTTNTNSSMGSINRGGRDEGEAVTSRRKSSSSRSQSSSVAGIRTSNISSLPSTKMTQQKSFDRCSRQFSDITDDSRNIDSRTTNTNSSMGSINRGDRDEGEAVTSRRNSSSSRSRSSGVAGTDRTSNISSLPSTKMTQSLPPRRSVSQDVRRESQSMPPEKVMMHIENDDTTASLTGSSKGSIDGTDVMPITKEEERRSQVMQGNRGTIHVRQMRWTDPKNGQSGTYTGQVNARFIPHGRGLMEYDPNPNNDMSGLGVSVVLVKDGEWKDGRFRRNHHRMSINDSRSNQRSSSCGIKAVGSEEGDRKRLSSSQSSSKSGVINCDDEPRRSRSFHGTSYSQHKRSSSMSAKQVSF